MGQCHNQPKFRIRQMRNRFTTRNQWFTESIETVRTSGLTFIISTIRFFKTYTAEFGINVMSYSEKKYGDKSLNDKKLLPLFSVMELKDGIYTFEGTLQRQNEIIYF